MIEVGMAQTLRSGQLRGVSTVECRLHRRPSNSSGHRMGGQLFSPSVTSNSDVTGIAIHEQPRTSW